MFGRKLKARRQGDVRHVKKGFVDYQGYVPELNLFRAIDGKWFKVYQISYPKRHPAIANELLNHDGYHLQLIFSNNQFPNGDGSGEEMTSRVPAGTALLVAGCEADTPEDAAVEFSRLENEMPHPSMSAEEWFSYMSWRLKNEPFAGFPTSKRKKYTAISRVQPFNVKTSQKEMEISGLVSRTVLLIGYPSVLDESFASELISVSRDITICVHCDKIDLERCLAGIDRTKDIRPTRRETMRARIHEAIDRGENLYNTCALINLCDSPGGVERSMEKVKKLCEKYFIGFSELDFQQEMAFKSTLPILDNRIRYNRVLGQDFIGAMLPWSELAERKKVTFYGVDPAFGEVRYDRRVGGEYGLILASDHNWAVRQAAKEIASYRADDDMSVIRVIADADTNLAAFGGGETTVRRIAAEDTADRELLKKLIVRWAETFLSVNGQLMRKHANMIRAAIDQIADGSLREMIDRFLENMPDNERRVLSAHPFPETVTALLSSSGQTIIFQVTGTRLEREIGYVLLFNDIERGPVYSLNTEYMTFLGDPILKEGPYTLLTATPRQTYEAPYMKDFLANFPFALIGEHRVADKLALCENMPLTKKQRAWISAPANGAVLIAQYATYFLKAKGENDRG